MIIKYEVYNTINEQGVEELSASFSNLEAAKEYMAKYCANFYSERGTGVIYKSTYEQRLVKVKKKKVFERGLVYRKGKFVYLDPEKDVEEE